MRQIMRSPMLTCAITFMCQSMYANVCMRQGMHASSMHELVFVYVEADMRQSSQAPLSRLRMQTPLHVQRHARVNACLRQCMHTLFMHASWRLRGVVLGRVDDVPFVIPGGCSRLDYGM